MVKSELHSVSYCDKLSSAGQLIKEDLSHSAEMINSALKETVLVNDKKSEMWAFPSNPQARPGLIMNAGHKSVKLVKHSRRKETETSYRWFPTRMVCLH